jgi:hypothetical protein
MRKLVRISDRLDKITLLDWILHLFGIHLVRRNVQGTLYCRICNKQYKH